MRVQLCSVLLLSPLVSGRLFADSEYLEEVEETTTITGASPASVPTSGSPAVTLVAGFNGIELRQRPGIAQVDGAPAPIQQPPATITTMPAAGPAPAIPIDPALPVPGLPAPVAVPAPVDPAINPIPPPSPAPPLDAIMLAAPAPPINVAGTAGADVTRLARPFSNVPFYTVVWAETWIGGTYSTWWPHTVSLDFKPVQSHAPLPGIGEIGMGTLTGKTGVTRTVVVNAAPTQAAGWAKGLAAVVGVGMAGMVV